MPGFKISRLSLDLEKPFRISRGAKTRAELVQVEIREGAILGQGECCPYPHYGESPESVENILEALREEVETGLDIEALQTLLPAGAARNALDCALYDFKANQSGIPVYKRLNLPRVRTFTSFRTVTLESPGAMAEQARAYPERTPLKVKLDSEKIKERLEAVKNAAPQSPIMVDANEAWSEALLRQNFPVLKNLGVVLVEQPLPAGKDDCLAGLQRAVPVLADEVCHSPGDIPKIQGKYDAVNIKLDKTGGLTGALALLKAAREANLGIFLGCMVSSSLSIAPIAHLCSHADFIDLDGPLLLKDDPGRGLRQIKDSPEVEIRHPWGQAQDYRK